MTTVDIIVPTYKRAHLLPEALNSVVAQTFSDWRCWVAEDGETETTRASVRPFLEGNRFAYLPGSFSGTPAVPRNRAIKMGSAPYIAFLDDDDVWMPEKLERQLAFLKRHPGCILLGSNGYRWAGDRPPTASLPLYFSKLPRGRLSCSRMLEQDYFINSSVIISRVVLKNSGLINESIFPGPGSEDYEFWIRISSLGEAWVLSDPLVAYRMPPSASTHAKPRKDRVRSYQTNAKIYTSALAGVPGVQSPLTYPENRHYAAACRNERDFYLAGPRFLGRWRHGIAVRLKSLLRSRRYKINR